MANHERPKLPPVLDTFGLTARLNEQELANAMKVETALVNAAIVAAIAQGRTYFLPNEWRHTRATILAQHRAFRPIGDAPEDFAPPSAREGILDPATKALEVANDQALLAAVDQAAQDEAERQRNLQNG